MERIFKLVAALLGFAGFGGLFVVEFDLFGRLVLWGSCLGAVAYALWARSNEPFLRWRSSYGAALVGGMLLPTLYGLLAGVQDPFGLAAEAFGYSLPISLIYATVLPFFDVARRVEAANEDQDLDEPVSE